jgi:uncharacterized protein (DUF2062 family)
MSTVTVANNLPLPGKKTFARLKAVLQEQLQQGLEPRQLALALALGVSIGLLPTVWGTSVICILLAWLLRLNQLVVQMANYLVYPLQILLFVPYFQLGEKLFASNYLPTDLEHFLASLQQAPWQLLAQYWAANLQAALVWLLSLPLWLLASYWLALLLSKKIGRSSK